MWLGGKNYLQDKKTRISPQWRSARSTTAHIVLYLRSLIWGFRKSCTIVHSITSQQAMRSEICCLDISLNFHRFGCNVKGDFSTAPLVLEARGGRCRLRKGLFDSTSMGSYERPIDTYILSLTVFELLSWLVKHFCPSASPTDPDTVTVNTRSVKNYWSGGKNQKAFFLLQSSTTDGQSGFYNRMPSSSFEIHWTSDEQSTTV